MIQEHELRIGNLVLIPYNKSNKKEGFYQARIEKIGEFGSYIKPEDYEPILITEELLLKFGFVKTENGWLRLTICNDWSYLYWERLAGFSLSVDKHGISLPYIKHVHQLQNLYFALTGEELILKEV